MQPYLYFSVLFLFQITAAFAQSQADYTLTKLPSPPASSVRSFGELPDGSLLAGTTAGVYKSTDAGESWQPSGLPERVIDELYVTNTGTILAGTYRAGLFRSADRGRSWELVGFDKNVYLFSMVQDNSDAIYLTTALVSDGAPVDTPVGVFKSTDDGKTWSQTSLTDNLSLNVSAPKPGLLFAAGRTNFYRSTDHGVTWVPSGTGLPDSIPVAKVIRVGNDLLAAVGNRQDASGQSGGGIFRSDNDGKTWKRSDSGLAPDTKVNALCTIQSQVFAGTGFYAKAGDHGLYTSADGGKTWQPTGLHDDIIRLVAKTSGGKLVAGTDGSALFFSKNKGRTWQQSGKEIDNWITRKVVRSNDRLYVNGAGIWTSANEGKSWEKLIKSSIADFTFTDTGKLLVWDDNQVLSSNDHGKSWEKVAEIPGESAIFSPSQQDLTFIQVFGNGEWFSKDNGQSWQKIAIPGLEKSIIRAIYLTSGRTMLASVLSKNLVFRSTDFGKSWEQMDVGVNFWNFTSTNGILFAGTYARGMYKSRDDGKTWAPCNQGLRKDNDYLTISALTTGKDNVILCGSFGEGAFISRDLGESWQPYPIGSPGAFVTSIFHDGTGSTYSATTRGIIKKAE